MTEMTDDLTERLRREQDYSDQKWHGNTYRIYTEAADRIEELEALLRGIAETYPGGYIAYRIKKALDGER